MKLGIGAYDIDILVQGFPGKSVCHGGLGWSTIALLRGNGRTVLIDVGSFSQRTLIEKGLAERGCRINIGSISLRWSIPFTVPDSL